MEGRIGENMLKRETVPVKFSFSNSSPKRETYVKRAENAELRQVSQRKSYKFSWCHRSLII